MKLFSLLTAAALVLSGARRYWYWAASLLPSRRCDPARSSFVSVLVAARNEAHLLPRMLAALEQLDYPRELLSFVLVSDGSSDSTPRLMERWCSSRPNAFTVHLPERVGKGAALARALQLAAGSELILVLDADTEPQPEALACLAGAFRNPTVGAACGYLKPANSPLTVVSRYAALERWVFHLVVQRGKDRLSLDPPAIGALSMLRRKALESVGGFPVVAAAEDVHLSMELNRRGWRTRWIGSAVAREDVPTCLRGFLRQRTRWTRGLLSNRRSAGGMEHIFVAAGYLDRLVFVVAAFLAASGNLSPWLPLWYAAAPVAAVVTALARTRPARSWKFLAALVPMAAADLAVTAASAIAELIGAPIVWAQRADSEEPPEVLAPDPVAKRCGLGD